MPKMTVFARIAMVSSARAARRRNDLMERDATTVNRRLATAVSSGHVRHPSIAVLAPRRPRPSALRCCWPRQPPATFTSARIEAKDTWTRSYAVKPGATLSVRDPTARFGSRPPTSTRLR